VNQKNCPCGSGQAYLLCCAPYHKGKIASSAMLLLRSRYSAYALNLPHYIIETTHIENSEYQRDVKEWEKRILNFSSTHFFEGVEILSVENKREETTIRFIARLKKGVDSASFIEKSLFVKQDGRWFYREGFVETHV
jgi:SEC-C motif domain protein